MIPEKNPATYTRLHECYTERNVNIRNVSAYGNILPPPDNTFEIKTKITKVTNSRKKQNPAERQREIKKKEEKQKSKVDFDGGLS